MDGGIKFDVSANTAKFEADMGRVKNTASTTATSVGNAFRSLGSLLAGGAVISGIQDILSKMDDISDMAKRFGTTAVDIQKVGNAAKIVGTDIDAVARSMNKAGVEANKAAREGGSLAEAFARVNIDPAKFAAAGLEERVKMVAEAQRAANGNAQKMADLFEVIGTKAANINFAELVSEMGGVSAASNETVEALANANDELDKMKQNAVIFGANLLNGIVKAGEMIGNLLSGNGPSTNNQVDEEIRRANAEANLKLRKKLLPSDSTLSYPAPIGPGDDVAPPTVVPGPNDLENLRRINEEMERMRKEAEASADAATTISEATAATATEEDKRAKQEADAAKFKQYMLEIDLKIKEAQAAGDKDRAARLQNVKDWTEAAVKYEGDLDKAARDVNATLKERNMLLEKEAANRQAGIEAELKRAETMAFGTDEAKKKAKWMDEYNNRLAKGATEEQARRFANADSYEAPKEETFQNTPRGSARLAPSSSGSDALSRNERVGKMRGEYLSRGARERAGDLFNRGMFNSAVAAEDRANRRSEAAMRSAQIKDAAGMFDFHGRKAGNAGEALKAFGDKVGLMKLDDKLRQIPGFDPKKSNLDNFKKGLLNPEWLKGQGKTPQEKEQEAKQQDHQNPAKGGGQPADPMARLSTKLDKVIKLMTERLPIRVLAA